jgi:hypothetical protein
MKSMNTAKSQARISEVLAGGVGLCWKDLRSTGQESCRYTMLEKPSLRDQNATTNNIYGISKIRASTPIHMICYATTFFANSESEKKRATGYF